MSECTAPTQTPPLPKSRTSVPVWVQWHVAMSPAHARLRLGPHIYAVHLLAGKLDHPVAMLEAPKQTRLTGTLTRLALLPCNWLMPTTAMNRALLDLGLRLAKQLERPITLRDQTPTDQVEILAQLGVTPPTLPMTIPCP